MDYIVDEEQFRLETLSSHTQYLAQLPLESEKELEVMQVKKEAKPNSDITMRESSVKQKYTRYSDQDKARLQPIDRNSEEKIQERLDWTLWHGQRKVHQLWSQFPKHEQQQQQQPF
ncbi:hypothetical protein RO3G_08571 [Rhizopus delemar RA 99-880]|uniref:Uncharacterized protein n=1 Tax=Rhizopus delemar (strain RA 99-880 / ATCC MYA-4621 / FGSC 9543 / NRRL 43880) TaxID=246409 RepID=I1C5Y6_RHIO9|nr:hypothetical protein RO3G_08571 [Rhizopus delemar RA 99-880]|eukprot:EIE83866.1 hypothetical protein RO3G_08571 [Rhizopus delemar RA 99-880]